MKKWTVSVRSQFEVGRTLIIRSRSWRRHQFKAFFDIHVSNVKIWGEGRRKNNGQNMFVTVTSRLACLAPLSGPVLPQCGEGAGVHRGNACAMCVKDVSTHSV